MTPYALAADLGGTQIRVALVDRDGQLVHRSDTPTIAQQGRDLTLDRFLAAIEGVALRARPGSLVGIGVAVASPTDPETGAMYNPPNLPGWDMVSLKPMLEQRLSLPTSVANDATLAALAEHRYGAGKGTRNMIYLTVSTGIGGGIIIEGKLYAGSGGFAGELGHITIDRNGPVCNCGNVGCLEALASGAAVARTSRERVAAGETSVLVERARSDLAKVDARMVAEAAVSGDRLAQAIMDDVATNLGIGIVSLVHAFDPELIVVGGGMSRSHQLLLPGITQEVDRHVMAHQRGRVEVVVSDLTDDVGVLGAAALAFDAYDIGR